MFESGHALLLFSPPFSPFYFQFIHWLFGFLVRFLRQTFTQALIILYSCVITGGIPLVWCCFGLSSVTILFVFAVIYVPSCIPPARSSIRPLSKGQTNVRCTHLLCPIFISCYPTMSRLIAPLTQIHSYFIHLHIYVTFPYMLLESCLLTFSLLYYINFIRYN